jgi:phage gpG-like protein
MQENFRVGGRPSPWTPSGRVQAFGGRTLRQTGALLKSLTVGADDRGSEIGSNVVYARIHALGGVIKPKKGDFLTFPVPGGVRTTSKSGKTLKKGVKEFGFVRVRQVTIPQRDYRFISPRGFSFALSAAARHLITR